MKALLLLLTFAVLVNESFAQKIEVIPPNGTKKVVTMSGGATIDANGVVSVAAGTTAGSLTFTIDGGGTALTTGLKGIWPVPFACTITAWTIVTDQTGSIVIDIWKDTYANSPPTIGDVITASAKPTVTTDTKATSSSLTGWTTSVAAGDHLAFNVNSITTVTRATLVLTVTKP